MERRIGKKCELYIQTLKSDMKDWMDKSDISKNKETYSNLLQFLYDYPNINLEKEDFQKRKRVKNMVPHFDRCSAKRASSEQCTRRKKNGSEYCGTHVKGTPHGKISAEDTINQKKVQKMEVFVQEIKGINYYIDKNNNVYKTEDIISNSKNPSIIAKYVKLPNGDYQIPSLNLM
jgi:hypothetical protein